MNAIRRWDHLLLGKHFTLVTDQKALSYMFNPQAKGKIKSQKFQLWRSELGSFKYSIVHKPGSLNIGADSLSRINSIFTGQSSLEKIHENLGHPGVVRLHHFVREKNLPYTMAESRSVCARCQTCAHLKPRFYKPPPETLIKATRPWERLSIDFKGPVKGVRPLMSTADTHLPSPAKTCL